MSNKEVAMMLDNMTKVHGVTRAALEQVPEDKLDWRPTPELRTIREIALHIYGGMKTCAEGVQAGNMAMELFKANEDPFNAPDKAALLAYADACVARLVEVYSGLTEVQLRTPVPTPYGEFDVIQHFRFMYDEHWHHRGQMYVYLRLLGIEPPFLYGYPD